jgi:dTDP-4-amino-4,6-dideoxygalactose transaminase
MKNIQMVDLRGQYLKIKPEIDSAIQSVIDSTAFIKGRDVQLFETELADFTGVKHAITCGNGTDAIQIALMTLDLKPGDEVITTTFTFIATAEAIALLGLIPVFVDADFETFNIDVKQIRQKITSKTKAIIPVHLYGQCSEMAEIMEIAEEFNLFVIEDTAQAIGTNYTFPDGTKKQAGTIGNIGTTSFFPSKNLGCFGDGGALFTNDDSLAQKIRSIINHGSKVTYYHSVIGVNSRLDTIQAAVLRIKLKHLKEYIAARQNAADFYNQAFQNEKQITTPFVIKSSQHTYHQYTLKLKDIDRNTVVEKLNEKSIPSKVYYPVPIHLQEAYAKYGFRKGDFSNAEKLSETVLSLPIHTEMSEEQLRYISENLIEIVRHYGK